MQPQALQGHIAASDIGHSMNPEALCVCLCGIYSDTVPVTEVCVECRYEVQGEYVIPPDTHIPDSAASMAPMELMGSRSGAPLKPPKSAFGQATGRWRLQVKPQTEHSVPCRPSSIALRSFQPLQQQQ